MDEQRILKSTHSHLTQRIKPKLHRIDFLRYVSIPACIPQSPSGAWFSHSQARAFPHLSTKSDKMVSLPQYRPVRCKDNTRKPQPRRQQLAFRDCTERQWHEPRDSSGPFQILLQPLSTRFFSRMEQTVFILRTAGTWPLISSPAIHPGLSFLIWHTSPVPETLWQKAALCNSIPVSEQKVLR